MIVGLGRSTGLRAAAVLWVATCLPVCVAQAGLIEDIQAKWRERQKKHHCFRISWVTKETIGKHSRTSFVSRPLKRLPDETLTFDGKGSLLVDGGRYRRDRLMPNWSEKEQQFLLKDASFTRDRNFFSVGGAPFPTATILKEVRTLAGVGLDNRPVLQFYRPFVVFGEPPALELGGLEKESVRKEDVLIVTESGPHPVEITLDPRLEYAPTRCVYRADGEVRWVIESEYGLSQEGDLRLKGWTKTHFGREQRLLEMTAATVVELELNPVVSDKDFEVVLPAGAWVRDQVTNTEYIVRADGSNRLIEPNERDVYNYDALLKTETGESPYPPPEGRGWGVAAAWIAGSGAVALVVVLILVRRRTDKRIRSGSAGRGDS